MKQKLLFLVTMLTMAWAGMTTAKADTFCKVKSKEIDLSSISTGGLTTVDNIMIIKDLSGKELTIALYPDNVGGNVINVPDGNPLVHIINSDDTYDRVTVAVPQDVTVNASNFQMFIFYGSATKNLKVDFVCYDPIMGDVGDVTLTLNETAQTYSRAMFNLAYTTLSLNTSSTTSKLNMNCISDSEKGGGIFNARYPSYVYLGYGDYHFVSQYLSGDKSNFNFFSQSSPGNMKVSGLGRFDSYDENNYLSTPRGAQLHSDGVSLFDCNDNQIMGEVTLSYLSSDYQHFGPNDESEWRIRQSCEGLILDVYGSGDLSSVTEMPWEEYKGNITEVYVNSLFMYDDFIALPEGAFKDFSALKRANIAGAYTLESISKHCFENCPELETFEFPSMYSITTIGDSAFKHCTSLGTLYLPDGIEEIGQYAFSYCSVSDITIPATLKIVGRNAFYKCHTLRISQGIGEVTPGPLANGKIFTGKNLSLYYEGTLEEWLTGDFSWVMDCATDNKEHLFIDGNEIIDLVIPEGITELNHYAFASCTGLKSVTFPSTLTKIGARAFKRCSGITGIDLPDNITEILIECFAGCGSVTTLKLSKGLTVIRDQAFTNLSITELTIPDGVTKIGSSAFAYNNDLTEVTLPKNLSEISNESFERTQLKKVIVPSGIGEVAMSGSSTQFSQVTEIRFGGDLDEWLAYSREWLMKNVAKDYLDNNNEMVIRQLDLYLEGSDEPLKSVVIPDGVTEIPACAFHKTSITDLSFSEEVTSIGAGAFAGCYNLATAETKARIPAALGEDAFNDIDENAVLRVYSSAVADYEATDWGKYFKIEGAFAEFKVTAAASDEALGEVTLTFGDEDVLSKGEEKNSFMVVKDAKGHLTATPKDKYTEFVMWNDDAEGFDQAERDVTITGDFDYIAKFKKDSFDVKVVAEGIDPASVEIIGAGKYGRGDKVTLTFKLKDEHYDFDMWLFDKNHFEPDETLVFDEIDANHDVQIVFKAKYYTVSATVTPAEAGVVKGQGDYEYGTNYTLTLEPAEGYELKEWRDGTVLDEKSNVLTGSVYGEIHIECVMQKKEATAIDDVTETQNQKAAPRKLLRNGVLYIERNGKTYNAQGQAIR